MHRYVGLFLLVFLLVLSSACFAEPNFIQQTLQNDIMRPSPSSVELAFSPNGGATELVVKAIASAKQNIRVAAYSFTSRPIAQALIDARRAGLDVEIVVDHDQIEKDKHSEVPALAAAGIPVHVDIVHTLMHDKYMVIDGKTVETGSFNYTFSAEQHNAENVIVLWDAPKLAAAYAENWKNLWDQAETYTNH